jgi:hypothetical protein
MEWVVEEARARDDETTSSCMERKSARRNFMSGTASRKIGDTIFMVGEQRRDECLFGRKLRWGNFS